MAFILLIVLFFGLLRGSHTSELTLGVVSWNLAEKIPNEGDGAFIKSLQEDDIVVLGSQECEDVKFRRHEGHKSRAWHALQKKALGKEFKNVASHSLGGIKLDIYVKNEMKKLVKCVHVMDVPCGIGNVIGNKGGICAVLKIKDSYVAIVNNHFAAHQSKVKERNADYARVVSTISDRLREEVDGFEGRVAKKRKVARKNNKNDEEALILAQERYRQEQEDLASSMGGLEIPSQPTINPKIAARFDARFDDTTIADAPFTELFDAVIFLGDFNYRLNVPRLEIELAREEGTPEAMEAIFEYDQLHQERSRGAVFNFYHEDSVTFLPTYKYDKNSDKYDSSPKMRSPAWTDRILMHKGQQVHEELFSFAPLNEKEQEQEKEDTNTRMITSKSYDAIDSRTSDHRPVVSRLVLTLR